jgi:hypothetical protein
MPLITQVLHKATGVQTEIVKLGIYRLGTGIWDSNDSMAFAIVSEVASPGKVPDIQRVCLGSLCRRLG